MYKTILTKQQLELLPLLQKFSKSYYLVGGTAIALHIGHRRSIDFDMFTLKRINRTKIKKIINQCNFSIQHLIYEDSDQLHIIINSVKLTFYLFPYTIKANCRFEKIISLPSLLDLGAMKAFALGRRAKWKDYVDMYFLFKNYFKFNEISDRAKLLFGKEFSSKLFRQQLSYFEDIDYTESVDFIAENVSEDIIKELLIDVATSTFYNV
jgi:hypothetical protein